MDQVRDNAAAKQFELIRDGVLAYARYVRSADVLDIQHTLVPKEAEGKGMATALIRGTLDIIRARGEKLVPTCPFVSAYMRRHPETQDLLVDPHYLETHPPEKRA
jgi:hypothetical protein